MSSTEYHFTGIDRDGGRWVLCGGRPVYDLEDARGVAARRLEEDDKFDRIEIYVLTEHVVEEVNR